MVHCYGSPYIYLLLMLSLRERRLVFAFIALALSGLAGASRREVRLRSFPFANEGTYEVQLQDWVPQAWVTGSCWICAEVSILLDFENSQRTEFMLKSIVEYVGCVCGYCDGDSSQMALPFYTDDRGDSE